MDLLLPTQKEKHTRTTVGSPGAQNYRKFGGGGASGNKQKGRKSRGERKLSRMGLTDCGEGEWAIVDLVVDPRLRRLRECKCRRELLNPSR